MTERYQKVAFQLQLLEARVTEGQLSLTGYLELLRAEVQRLAKLGRCLRDADRKDDASKIVKRLKTIQTELQNAEDNM